MRVEELIRAAQEHGAQSEPDHEVGDLQDILRSCWRAMTVEQRRAVFREYTDRVVLWLGSEPR